MSAKGLAIWHGLLEQKNFSAFDSILADDVVFHSPVVHTPQKGKEITSKYLRAAFYVLFNDTFKYVREVSTGRDTILEFVVEVDGIFINGVDMITWDENDLISEFKVMVRPLKATNLLHQKMMEMLEST